MINKICKYCVIFTLTVLTIIAIPQAKYASTYLTESNGNTPSDWAKDEVNKAVEVKLIPDSIQGKYRNSITRGEFSEIAVKLYEVLSGKQEVVKGKSPFVDTQNSQVIIANELGIVNGIGVDKFAPNDMVTREEISVMIYRTLHAAKPEYKYSNEYIHKFADNNMISSWARDSVDYLYQVGAINGVGSNIFNPSGETSREEAIILVKRTYDKVLASEKVSSNRLAVTRGSSRELAKVMRLKSLIPQELGKPYQWGATGPNSYDCSGLVYSLYEKLGVSLPRTSKQQSRIGIYVSKDKLIYGDLVFFASNGKTVNHVGIYIGNGNFVHSPNTGDVVKVSTIMSGYYADTYYSAKRILP
ncbi:MAG: hypothetical protein FH761_14930 [Firmicutes bacterium]|nr:hypothetical protein [Bacillota bacterium]